MLFGSNPAFMPRIFSMILASSGGDTWLDDRTWSICTKMLTVLANLGENSNAISSSFSFRYSRSVAWTSGWVSGAPRDPKMSRSTFSRIAGGYKSPLPGPLERQSFSISSILLLVTPSTSRYVLRYSCGKNIGNSWLVYGAPTFLEIESIRYNNGSLPVGGA